MLVHMQLYGRTCAFILRLVAEISSFYTAVLLNFAVFFSTDNVCMRLLPQKSAKFTLFSQLTILNERFLFKLIAQIPSYFAENNQKSHIFLDWSLNNAFLFSWFCNCAIFLQLVPLLHNYLTNYHKISHVFRCWLVK